MTQPSLFEEDNARPAPPYFEQWPDGPRGDNLPFILDGMLYAWECKEERDGYPRHWFPALIHLASCFPRRFAAFPVLRPSDALLGTQYGLPWPVLLIWNDAGGFWSSSGLPCAVKDGFFWEGDGDMSTAQLDLFGGSLRDEVLSRGGNPHDPSAHEQYHALFARWDAVREEEGFARQEDRLLYAWIWRAGSRECDVPTLRRVPWLAENGHVYDRAVFELADGVTLEPAGVPGRLLIGRSDSRIGLEDAVRCGIARRVDE